MKCDYKTPKRIPRTPSVSAKAANLFDGPAKIEEMLRSAKRSLTAVPPCPTTKTPLHIVAMTEGGDYYAGFFCPECSQEPQDVTRSGAQLNYDDLDEDETSYPYEWYHGC